MAALSATFPATATPPATPTVPLAGPAAAARVTVATVRVGGVGDHPALGITPARVQAAANDALQARAGGTLPAALDLADLQAVATAVTALYRQAGFLVALAYVPAQEIGTDGVARIEVMEGRVGRIRVQGDTRYAPELLSTSSAGLVGRPLLQRDLDSALLYARDLPGVSVTSVLQPGRNTGETDIVLVARDTRRPVQVSLGVNNHGTETSGRNRAELGLSWNNPLGLGDVFTASYAYAFDPRASRNGALSWSVPLAGVDGLSVIAGASQSELEVNTGALALLDLKGPAAQQYAGADWKFVNTATLQMTGSARYIHENSRFEMIGLLLSKQKYDVLDLGTSLRHTDLRWRGINLAQLSVRQALQDDSLDPDLVNPTRDSHFTVARLGYLRMQQLAETQRLLLRLNGQYSGDSLPALEQFQAGGNDSVRGYALGETMGDSGWYAALEYHVDAPGFADTASPFHGQPWRELLSFDVFVDQARVFDADHQLAPVDLASAGAGLTFRLPRFNALELRLAAAVPTSAARPADGDDLRVYARLGMTF